MRVQIAVLPHTIMISVSVQSMQKIKSILFGCGETNDLACSFIKFLGIKVIKVFIDSYDIILCDIF